MAAVFLSEFLDGFANSERLINCSNAVLNASYSEIIASVIYVVIGWPFLSTLCVAKHTQTCSLAIAVFSFITFLWIEIVTALLWSVTR
jgi:biotin transporter BioY